MRALSGTGRLAMSLALWMGIMASFPSVASAGLSECDQLKRLANFFGDGVAFKNAVDFADSRHWYKMLQGADSPWSNHVVISERALYRKMESMMDRVGTSGSKTRVRDLDSASTRFLSQDIAQEMLIEGFRRMDSLSAGKKVDPNDWIKYVPDPLDPSQQILRISFDVDRPIGMGFVMGKDRFSEPVRVEGIQRVAFVVRKTKSLEDPEKDYFHVLTFFPDAVNHLVR